MAAMAERHIGILHPGAMGVSVAASAKNSGNAVCWVSEGRSAETRSESNNFGPEKDGAKIIDINERIGPSAGGEEESEGVIVSEGPETSSRTSHDQEGGHARDPHTEGG